MKGLEILGIWAVVRGWSNGDTIYTLRSCSFWWDEREGTGVKLALKRSTNLLGCVVGFARVQAVNRAFESSRKGSDSLELYADF